MPNHHGDFDINIDNQRAWPSDISSGALGHRNTRSNNASVGPSGAKAGSAEACDVGDAGHFCEAGEAGDLGVAGGSPPSPSAEAGWPVSPPRSACSLVTITSRAHAISTPIYTGRNNSLTHRLSYSLLLNVPSFGPTFPGAGAQFGRDRGNFGGIWPSSDTFG